MHKILLCCFLYGTNKLLHPYNPFFTSKIPYKCLLLRHETIYLCSFYSTSTTISKIMHIWPYFEP
nr:MAG TPA: hypothetical protein [Caudoviricetes sp.]